MGGWRRHLFPLALLFLSIVVPYHRLVLGIDYLTAGDLVNETYVWKEFLLQSVTQGDFPLWYPRAFCGTVFAAHVQPACFYLPEYVAFFTGVFYLFGLLAAAHLFLAGIAVYGIAWRSLGERWSSLVAAVVFVHAGTTTLDVGYGMLRNLFPLAWLLTALWLFLRWIDGKGVAYWAGLALAVGMAWVCGSPQFVIYAFYLLGAIALWEFFARRKSSGRGRRAIPDRLRPFLGFLTAFGMGTALAAVQVIPLIEASSYVAGRSEGGSFEFATIDSYPPGMLPTFLYPFLYGDPTNNTYWATQTGYGEVGAYMGAVALLLALIGFLSPHIRSKNLWIVFAVGGILVAIGGYTPLYRLPYYLLPGFARMRVPARALFVTTFALAVLAGAGFRYLFIGRDPAVIHRCIRITAIALSILIILAAAGTFARGWIENGIQAVWEARVLREMDAASSSAALAQAAPRSLAESRAAVLVNELFRPILWGGLFLLVLLLRRRLPSAAWPAAVAALLVYADLLVFGARFIETAPARDFRATYYPLEPELAMLKRLQRDAAPTRFVALDDLIGWMGRDRFPGFRPNRPQVHGLCSARGLDPLIMSHYSRYFFEMQGDKDPDRFPHGTLFLPTLLPDYLPAFARLACPYVLTTQRLEGLRLLSDGPVFVYEFEGAFPRAFVLTGDDIEDGTAAARVTEWSADRVVVEGTTETAGTLILAETWYPGWQVTVNGKKRPLGQWEAFRSAPVPTGSFRAEFTFAPRSVARGAAVTALSFAVLLLVLPCRRWLKQRGKTAQT